MKILEAGTYKGMFKECGSMQNVTSSKLAKVNKLLKDLANEQKQTGLGDGKDCDSAIPDLQADLESTLGASPDQFMTSDSRRIDLVKAMKLAELAQIALELRNVKGKVCRISLKWRQTINNQISLHHRVLDQVVQRIQMAPCGVATHVEAQ